MEGLDSYLKYLHEGIFTFPVYCYILEYNEYGFSKILHISSKPLERGKSVKAARGFTVCLTDPNFDYLLTGKETKAPSPTLFFGKYSIIKFYAKLPNLKILDSGTATYSFVIVSKFKDMKLFQPNDKLICIRGIQQGMEVFVRPVMFTLQLVKSRRKKDESTNNIE